MKHLNKFNEELKSSTYLSAAKGLENRRHLKRAKSLSDWGEKVKLDEEEAKKRAEELKKQKFIDELKQLGVFQVKLSNRRDNENKVVDCYIDLYLEWDDFNEDYQDWKEGERDTIYIRFSAGFVPVDDEVDEYFKSKDLYKSGYTYWTNYMYLNLHDSTLVTKNKLKPSDMDFYNLREFTPDQLLHEFIPNSNIDFDSYEQKMIFADRANAAKFRKALSDIFEGKVILRESDKNPGGIKEELMDGLCSERDFPFSAFLRFIKSIRRISLNDLYNE